MRRHQRRVEARHAARKALEAATVHYADATMEVYPCRLSGAVHWHIGHRAVRL